MNNLDDSDIRYRGEEHDVLGCRASSKYVVNTGGRNILSIYIEKMYCGTDEAIPTTVLSIVYSNVRDNNRFSNTSTQINLPPLITDSVKSVAYGVLNCITMDPISVGVSIICVTCSAFRVRRRLAYNSKILTKLYNG